ncbi:Netrin receptor UNC5D [Takifugu flavidus]|uniref:Netrin receptor UNC5D n=1 Tax=Takifugu flavidus TaxID=433684 RepID=A0A5C6N0R5_9TELE|nr:Netrin receptor UNC5D [Takifugu flavidus]
MSIAHCAEVDMENWNILLKRRTQDSKWESMALLKIRFRSSIGGGGARVMARKSHGCCQTVGPVGADVVEVMSTEEESTSCYCLMDSTSCHLLLDQPGSYALVGEPLTQAAVKRLKLAVFGSVDAGSLSYSLRVYSVDDTPHAFQGITAAFP